MCGIAGLIAEHESAARDAVEKMSQAQIHRGPNDSGTAFLPFGGRTLGFGFRRLSILDLSPAGHQPMVHAATGNTLIFNGEIYNYKTLRAELEAVGEKLSSTGDTEVLLTMLTRWGTDIIKRLEGMFAFAFYNAREQSLTLARDSMGIKPLYVAHGGGSLLFASEVRAILASGLVSRKIDMQGITGLLAYGAVQHPRTVFRDINSFPPGAYQTFHAMGHGATQGPITYWTCPKPNQSIGEPDAVAAIERTLDASVRDHLASDVPIGVFLSSGLDSTVIAALAAKHTDRLRSFTVGFADQPDMSELSLAKETARIFNLDHTEIQVNNSDAEESAMAWMQSLDQPSMDGLNVYIISRAVRAQGITVALSGQGGDELFGGYPSFSDVPRLLRWMRGIGWMPSPLRVAICNLATGGRSEAVRQKMADVARTDGTIFDLYFQRRRAMSDNQLASLGLEAGPLGLTEYFLPRESLAGVTVDDDDVVWSVSQLESRFYQGNMLLRDGDVNGMAHSLEIRVPMLDQRMLDLMLAIPGNVRIPNAVANKHLLRLAFAPYLRPVLLAQRKRGFTLPIARWMYGPLRDLCQHALVSLKSLGIVRQTGIEELWNAFLDEPESPIWSRTFTLCVLGMYLKKNQAVA